MSSGDVHLGELKIIFELHLKDPLKKEAGEAKSLAKGERKDLDVTAEFIVGPGAPFKKAAPARAQGKQVRIQVRGQGARAGGLPESEWGQKGSEVVRGEELEGGAEPTRHQEVCSAADQKTSPSREGAAAQLMGEQQMQVISELLERGTALRDRMIHSLAAGVQQVR